LTTIAPVLIMTSVPKPPLLIPCITYMIVVLFLLTNHVRFD
jgi:hypothetical protein